MSAAKKQFYTVVKGRAPGIYEHWSGPGGAEEQVKGFPGAVYKGFATHAEAENYLRSAGKNVQSPVHHQAAAQFPALDPLPVDSPPQPQQAGPGLDYSQDLEAGKVVIFTDGASTGNPGPGGYGVVLLFGTSRKELSAGFRCTTNNRMELLACIAALRELNHSRPVIVYSDSRYVVNAVEKGWARRWQKNGWMRRSSADGQPQRAENVDLWEEMLDLLIRQPVEFRWIKGHADHRENERCDYLAVQAARGPNLPPDTGFQGRC